MLNLKTRYLFLALFFFLIATPAFTRDSDLCEATALVDVPESTYTDPLKKGEVIDAVTQYNVDKATGEAQLCAHGGGCFATKIKQNGQIVDTLKLNNCEIDLASPTNEGDHISYGMNLLRAKVDSRELREDDIYNQLESLGLCPPCASNLADAYIKQPKSQCARPCLQSCIA